MTIVVYRVREELPACCLKVGEVIHMRTRDKSKFENFLIVDIQPRMGTYEPNIVLKLRAVGFRYDRKNGVYRPRDTGPVMHATVYDEPISRIIHPGTTVRVVGDTIESEVPLLP